MNLNTMYNIFNRPINCDFFDWVLIVILNVLPWERFIIVYSYFICLVASFLLFLLGFCFRVYVCWSKSNQR